MQKEISIKDGEIINLNSKNESLKSDLEVYEQIVKKLKKEKNVLEIQLRKKVVEIEEKERKQFIEIEEMRENQMFSRL